MGNGYGIPKTQNNVGWQARIHNLWTRWLGSDQSEGASGSNNTENSLADDCQFGSTCQYRISSGLGAGTFSSVSQATIVKRGDFTGDKIVAVKIHFPQDDTSRTAEEWEKRRALWEKLLTLKHAQVVPYHTIRVFRSGPSKLTRVEYMMDYYSDGDLNSMLKSLRREYIPFELSRIVCFAMQMADGLQYIHAQNIVHGDVKPANVLVRRIKSSHEVLLIGDLYGVISMRTDVETPHDTTHLHETQRYMSPEMLQRFTLDVMIDVGQETDVWSLGCIILELTKRMAGSNTEYLLYNERTGETVTITTSENEAQFAYMVMNEWLPFVPELTPHLSRIIRKCLTRSRSKRISARELRECLQEQVGLAQKRLMVSEQALRKSICPICLTTFDITPSKPDDCMSAEFWPEYRNLRHFDSKGHINVENFVKQFPTDAARYVEAFPPPDQLLLIGEILQNMEQLHGTRKGGYDFMPSIIHFHGESVALTKRNLSEFKENHIKYHHEEAVRVLLYAAPEVLRGLDTNDIRRMQMADIWSFACFCLYVISGEDPKYYRRKLNGEQCLLNEYKNAFVAITLAVGDGICIPDYEPYCENNSALTELFRLCFQFEPEHRPTTTQLTEELLPECIKLSEQRHK